MSDLDQLEARVERDRKELSKALDDLTDTLAPGEVAQSVASTVQDYGGELGRQTVNAAKANPAAFILAGAGLALLLAGPKTERPSTTRAKSNAAHPDDALVGFDERVRAADAAMNGPGASASGLKAALDKGLEKLPPEAQARVRKARYAALDAQEQVEKRLKSATSKAQKTHQSQPLVTGALALGVGALVGALLPKTQTEDEMLGQKRDALMAEARLALRREVDALGTESAAAVRRAGEALQPDARRPLQ